MSCGDAGFGAAALEADEDSGFFNAHTFVKLMFTV
jgi:hypothetical protein